MWAAVRKACEWAFSEAKSGMPKGVGEKVKFVREKLGAGTWGCVMGGGKGGGGGGGEGGISEAARANHDAVRAYGKGGNTFGQPQGMGQHMGFGGQPQQGFAPQQQVPFGQHQTPQMPFAQTQQGMAAAPNSPGVGQPIPQQGMFAPQVQGQGYSAPPPQGYGALPAQNHGHGPVRMIDDVYAQAQGVSGGGGGGYAGPPPPIRQASRGGGGRGGYSQSMGGNWM